MSNSNDELNNKKLFISNQLNAHNIPFLNDLLIDEEINSLYDNFNNTDINTNINPFASYAVMIDCDDKNEEIIVKCFLIAYEQNYIPALQSLALHYEKTKNYDSMIKYLLLSIDKNIFSSARILGMHYKDIEKNYELAEKYLSIAYNNDESDLEALDELAHISYLTKQYDLMIQLLLKTIEKGSVIAITNLAIYYNRIGDYDNMEKYALIAIDKKDTNAMVLLATHYMKKINGDITDNLKLALKYLMMSYELNNPVAMINLGIYYQNHVENQDDLMIKFYLMVINYDFNYENLMLYYITDDHAESMIADAAYNLGIHYYRKDHVLTKKYLLIADEHGHENAKNFLYQSLI